MSNQGEVFTGGATTSQHVDAEDDDHFQNTTFKLKRTRSLGLLDEFIDPSEQEKNIESKNQKKEAAAEDAASESASVEDSKAEQPAPVHTPTPPFIDTPELVPHDDSDLTVEPWRHVDYLSHQWDVSDICKSWRYVISQRKSVANAARLENASWRTWAQRRSNLKTISPEVVNWSKESDITWLYGPILFDDDHDMPTGTDEQRTSVATATNAVAGDVAIARRPKGPKPILKKRTVGEMMISTTNLRKLEVASIRAEHEQRRRAEAEQQRRAEAAHRAGVSSKPPEYFDYNVISAKLNSQYKNHSNPSSRSNSGVSLPELKQAASASAQSQPEQHQDPASQEGTQDHLSAQLEKIISQGNQDQKSPLQSSFAQRGDSASPPAKAERHIHFNEEVQQCIVIDDPTAPYDGYYAGSYGHGDDQDYGYGSVGSYIYDDYDEDSDMQSQDSEEDADDDDEEGGFFLRVRSPTGTNHHPGLHAVRKEETDKSVDDTDDGESISTTSSRAFKTIQLLPSTTLNYGTSDEESDDENPYTSSLSHNVSNFSNRGYDYHYDYNTVYQVDPNHAIYGTGSKDRIPDVVDVPENIALGSNFDYEIIENEDIRNFDDAPLDVLGHGSDAHNSSNSEKLPISSLNDSAATQDQKTTHGNSAPNPFSLDDGSSDSDSDDDDPGLSISARNSSQSLAHSVFGGPMTDSRPEFSHQFEKQSEPTEEQGEPSEGHISQINPRYSSTGLSKQPHSSNSLSGQFASGFGDMTKAEDNKELSSMFFNPVPTHAEETTASDELHSRLKGGATSPPLQKKASLLPPHTTSTNAFSGKASPPIQRQPSKSAFSFESDSDSDSELEDAVPPSNNSQSPNSYSSLSKLADENGLKSPSDSDDGAKRGKGSAVASFLGGWNKNSS